MKYHKNTKRNTAKTPNKIPQKHQTTTAEQQANSTISLQFDEQMAIREKSLHI